MSDFLLEPGAEFGEFRIERFLSAGGMGEVYEARQPSLERRVALKVISPALGSEPEFRQRFQREARAIAALDHQNIPPIYAYGEGPDGRLYVAMRFVEGSDLEHLLQTSGRLTAEQCLDVLSQVADALDAAHARGVIHRDVKPANVMLEGIQSGGLDDLPATGRLRVFLTDFGLAKRTDMLSQRTPSGYQLGTPGYMAPEQIEGRAVDARTDVYALGATAYRCLTGEAPYPRESWQAVMFAHLHEPVPLPSEKIPGLAPAFDTLVSRAMAKDPADRPDSCSALLQETRRALQDAGATATVRGRDSTLKTPTEAQSRGIDVPQPAFKWRLVAHMVAYAPLWVLGYLVGRLL